MTVGDQLHHEEFFHALDDRMSEQERLAMERAILEQETLEMLTVGIDIGSSTSHLLFARIFFQRQAHRLSDRFTVVNRVVVWRSPIMLTPFLQDGTIDAAELSRFINGCYAAAGFTREDVDSGAVILTGEAIKRRNARAIDSIFAEESGKFVCATAGHRLESMLAAHGSGAVAMSRVRGACGLHVDIGGGTTKLALIDRGAIVSVAAFAVGGRLLAQDHARQWTRVDESAGLVAKDLGIEATPANLADEGVRGAIVARLAELVVDQIDGGPRDDLGRALLVTDPLTRSVSPDYISFSGGVSEYVFGRETHEYGDIAAPLATAIVDRLRARVSIPSIDAGQRIRATVIGASQFTVQLSGKTVHLDAVASLPLRNVPVVPLGQPLPDVIDSAGIAAAFTDHARQHDVDLTRTVALAVSWSGTTNHRRLRDLARGIQQAADLPGVEGHPLLVVVDADVAHALGALLKEEVGLRRSVLVLDAIELGELDFVDVGAYLDPPGVVAVVVKSLLFS